jgi:hypothetical protein
MNNQSLSFTLLLVLTIYCSGAQAFRSVDSTQSTAGYRFNDSAANTQPVIVFRQHVHMLADVDDRLTMTIHGDGRVLVHYPVYMKRAGDYEMQLDKEELVSLLSAMAANGVMDFDAEKTRERIRGKRRAIHVRAKAGKAELFEISDAVDSIIDVRLDEYRRNSAAAVNKNFSKRFHWQNIEHDARRFSDEQAIVRASRSVTDLRRLMKDARLKRIKPSGQSLIKLPGQQGAPQKGGR